MAESFETVCAACGGINRLPASKLRDGASAGGAKCGKCGAKLISDQPVAISQAAFDRFVGRSDIPVLVDFWAPWCGPCKTLGPVVDRVSQRLSPKLRFAKVNIDEAQALATRLNIQAVPTLAVFRRGAEIARTTGALPESALADWASRAASQ